MSERSEVQRVDDRDIAEYNKSLLVKYEAHINCKPASTEGVIKYLFKYIFKGTDKVLHMLTDKTLGPANQGETPKQVVVSAGSAKQFLVLW